MMSTVARWLGDAVHDVRFAVRTLRTSPSFAVVSVLTLALGIGATTAIWSVIDTVLLQPLPFTDGDRLVRILENATATGTGRAYTRGIRYQDFVEWRARTRTLSELVASSTSVRLVRTGEGTTRLWGEAISADTFTLLGSRAILGRTFDASDEANPDVVVLSFDTWHRLFHAAPDVVGKTLEAGDREARPLTIVGVLPAGFEFPTEPREFYTPLAFAEGRPAARITMIGRLRPGVSLQTAMDEANVIGNAITPPLPANAPPLSVPRFEVQSLKELVVQDLRPALRVLLVAVAVVLVIVCANVANLLLARSTARQREMAVRLAIGASKGRVARQVMAECLVLAIVGGALGAVFAAGAVTLVKALASVDAPGIFRLSFGTSILPRVSEVHVNLHMFAVACGIASVASLAFGVLPALHLSRTNHLHVMTSRGSGVGRIESRIRASLVVGQLVMATVLLVSAGLLTRSFITLMTVEKGYDSSHALAFQLVFPADYSMTRKADTIDAMLDGIRAIPNVEAAGFTRAGVLIGEEIIVGTFVPQGRTLAEMRADPVKPLLRPVSPGYLTAIGSRVLDGRDLVAADSAAVTPAIVMTKTVAQRFFEDRRAVGQLVDWHVDNGLAMQTQVVGVVEDLRNESLEHEPNPEVFIDYRQLLRLQWRDSIERQDMRAIGLLSFAVRTRTRPESAIPAVSQIVRLVDPNAGIDAIAPLDRLVASSVARQRFYAVTLGTFAAIAGVLAAIGVYGVLAYSVVQRTQEIGVRMALGAQRAQVLALVLRKGMLLTAIGIALGLVGAAVGTRLLQGMLFGITPLDLTTFVAVTSMFALVATLASYVPARRATKVDPMVTLRSE